MYSELSGFMNGIDQCNQCNHCYAGNYNSYAGVLPTGEICQW